MFKSSIVSLSSKALPAFALLATVAGAQALAQPFGRDQVLSQYVNQSYRGYGRLSLDQLFSLYQYQGQQVVEVQMRARADGFGGAQGNAQLLANGFQQGASVSVYSNFSSDYYLDLPPGRNILGHDLRDLDIALQGQIYVEEVTIRLRDAGRPGPGPGPHPGPGPFPGPGYAEELSSIAGESFYPGSGGVYNAVVNIYDRGYRSFILTTDRPRAVLSGRAYVQCNGGGQFVGLQTTSYRGMPAATFYNPCGGRANRIDFYLDAYGFKPRGYYTVLGLR